ncbi:uncharacterized protein PHACADRAFT_181110 [Phanerochaete carnosa HHB-10118-sp]|uniref:Uncharacterized protein n=1 Tax=Phanerochaete carnosa (strain HHB-10118-sp) TaxID=650164 RepID=K5V8G8_PHACS|nr:uncharacterized protein PHACADRAFT_181110 [Phanerochaete carnosa HHB-10118-sp]EKM59106.1 hypothetical protein PHACADRAFT_181110 [Phanerochaete carnosa HHB-10118-sp]
MSTIFTCVYLSVHIDVPDQSKAKEFVEALRDMPKNWTRRTVRHLVPLWHLTARPLCRRVFWMVFNIFAPELVILVAILERRSASDGVKFMRSRGRDDWNVKLAFFADMGGFELDDGTHFRDGLSLLKWFDNLQRTHDEGIMLNIDPLVEEISNRCNADLVLKVFTCLQALWLLVETSVRLVERKAVSKLEITTCAYIFCTIFAYACWLQKPYGVEGRVTIRDKYIVPRNGHALPQQSSPLSRNRSYSILHTSEPAPSLTPLVYTGSLMMGSQKTESTPTYLPIMIFPGARFTPFNRSYLHPDASWPLGCHIAGLLGAVVGLIHGIPLWNALFVTTTGQWLWRASCITQVVMPVAIAAIAVIELWYSGVLLFLAMLLMAFLYCVSRMVLFALIWIFFWSLPTSVYLDIDWAWAYVPHWH